MRAINIVLGALFALQAVQAETEPLPVPTGPHKTGRMSYHWKDTGRDELETSAADDKGLAGEDSKRQADVTVQVFGQMWP